MRYCASVIPFLLIILVQYFMLIKSHIKTWIWKSTENKLFASKVLKNNLRKFIATDKETQMEHHHGISSTS